MHLINSRKGELRFFAFTRHQRSCPHVAANEKDKKHAFRIQFETDMENVSA